MHTTKGHHRSHWDDRESDKPYHMMRRYPWTRSECRRIHKSADNRGCKLADAPTMLRWAGVLPKPISTVSVKTSGNGTSHGVQNSDCIHPNRAQGLAISLWDGQEHANTERFQGSVPSLPRLCPLSVPKGGVCGVYSESP